MFLQTALKCENNLLEINANEFLTWFCKQTLDSMTGFREISELKFVLN